MGFENFWERAAADPTHVAIVESDEHAVTAGELLVSANQLVHGLRALGLQPGDAIAAVLPSSLEAYEIFLAMQQAGWYLTPINFHLVGPEIAYVLQDREAKACVAHELFADACAAAEDEAAIPASARFAIGSTGGVRDYPQRKRRQPTRPRARRLLT